MSLRREREKEFKKDLILEAARKLLSDSPFEAITVEDIARASEFGKGTIYQYFESKEDILVHLVEQGLTHLKEKVAAECMAEPDPIRAVDAYLELQYRFYSEYMHLFLSMLHMQLRESSKPGPIPRLRAKIDEKIELMAAVLARGMDAGLFIRTDPAILARTLDKIIKGFAIERLEKRDQFEIRSEDLDLIRKILIYGIYQHDGGAQ
ncbi:MAG: TetR/AcrR family transcriptional regulator [Solirubrobacterales bacterium]